MHYKDGIAAGLYRVSVRIITVRDGNPGIITLEDTLYEARSHLSCMQPKEDGHMP